MNLVVIKLCLILLLLPSKLLAQSLTDTLDRSVIEFTVKNLSEETIQNISPNGRIFILSNNNSSYSKGDFITLVLNEDLVCRAIVAKTARASAGIKNVKIYNEELWKSLNIGTKVKVIRGDDSYFRKETAKEEADLIKSEEDLFNDTALLNDDLSIEDERKSVLKTDNLITATFGSIDSLNVDGSTESYSQVMGAWAYQVSDNFWGELSYGQNIIEEFPNEGLSTKLTNLTIRFKYAVKGPLLTFIKPYVGYQIVSADSPGAGVEDPDDTTIDSDDLARELELVEAVKENNLVFGVTILRRLVPAWFLRADIGSDVLSVGFGFEF